MKQPRRSLLRRSWGNQRGSALVGVVAFAMILSVMAMGYLNVVSMGINNAERALDDARAFSAGESGMQLGAFWFFQNVSATTNLSEGAALSDVIPELCINGFRVQIDVVRSSSGVTLRSTVFCGSRLGYNKIISQDAAYGVEGTTTTYPFSYAGFGKQAVTMSGNGATDSYNSATGSYGGVNLGSNGSVGTNGSGVGAIALSGNATVKGNAETGVGGTVTMTSNAKVVGTISHECAKNYPSVKVPSSLTSLVSDGNFSMAGNSSLSLYSGEYRYSSFSVTANGKLTISGHVTLYVTGEFKTAGNGKVTITPGSSLTLYIDGKTDIAGNGVINSSNLPANFLINSTYSGSTDGVKIAGNGDLYGGIYAPDSEIKIAGNGENYGALIADKFTVTGNGNIHHDEALTNVGVNTTGPEDGALVAGTWMESDVQMGGEIER